MIKFENAVLPSSEQWEAIIIGTRNPMNSWDKSDSKFVEEIDFDPSDHPYSMIQLLPSSYNQKRTVMLNYEVLAHIWNDRRNHKLDEWREHTADEKVIGYFGFCDWIKTLPYSELITQEVSANDDTRR